MNLIIEYQYLPNVYLFSILYNKTNIVFEQYENYQKMSFRNRCLLAGSGGVIGLSVPLEKGRDQKALITEVRIDNSSDWQERHWRTIESCYRKSPWFEYYALSLEEFYKKKYEILVDWNLGLFNWSITQLGLQLAIGQTESYQKIYDNQTVTDLRNQVLPKNYQSFPCAPYRQVFEERTGFLPNLSVLDLIFCEGKRAGEYLAGKGEIVK
jgi:hypothetical protein